MSMPARTLRSVALSALAVTLLTALGTTAAQQSPPPAAATGEDAAKPSRPDARPRRGGPTLCECLTKKLEARDAERCQGMLSVLELPAIELARRDCAKSSSQR